MSKILLETINLKKTFKHINGNITLFDNLNLKINHGDLVALTGPSGSGKSSLLHLFALLDEPSKGKILINNNETKILTQNQKDKLRGKDISIIFQENNLLTDFNALENVMMPLLIKGENKKNILEKAQKILKDLKIFNRSSHFPSELSGGEQQRVAVARALINEPKIIFADEPSGNLDSKSAENLHDLFFELRKKLNITIVIVTHNKELADMADRKLNLVDGKWFN